MMGTSGFWFAAQIGERGSTGKIVLRASFTTSVSCHALIGCTITMLHEGYLGEEARGPIAALTIAVLRSRRLSATGWVGV